MMHQINRKCGPKVVFVEPMGAFSNVFDQYMTIPMLGPLYLATIVEREGYEVSILNENIMGRKITPTELRDVDILCLSCMTATVDRGKEISRQYKALRRSLGGKSRTIIGGIHASMIPEDVMPDFDQVFIGEAETKILDVLEGQIQEKIVYGEKIDNLDHLPVPNFKLIKNWEKIKVWPIMTSRGCPYNCSFCSVTEMFGRRYRTKTIGRVLEEMTLYDRDFLFFVDDHFALDKDRTKRLLDLIDKSEMNVKWSCQSRTEVSQDKDLVAQMRRAGCTTVYVGFESISQKSLREMKKGQSVADIKRTIEVFKKNDINIHGMFMFGSDSDEKEIFKLTSKFCLESVLTSVQYLILTPFPGTVFYKKIEREGRLLHKNWSLYDAMHVVFQPKNLSPSELQQGMIDCFSDFYSYVKAFNEAIDVFFKTFLALGKKMYKSVSFPSITPLLIKAAGRRIVKKWISYNKPYLNYLKNVSLN